MARPLSVKPGRDLAFRRTTILGALVSVGVLVNVVLLNFLFNLPLDQRAAVQPVIYATSRSCS